jgi:hypothetical protein
VVDAQQRGSARTQRPARRFSSPQTDVAEVALSRAGGIAAMSFKIKPKKKNRRRGDLLLTTVGAQTFTYKSRGDGTAHLVRYEARDQHFDAVYQGPYCLLDGVCRGQHVQMLVVVHGFKATDLAIREPGKIWFFWDPEDDDNAFISVSHADVKNVALLAATISHEIPRDLADLLNIKPQMIRVGDIADIHENIRWRDLRNFEFRFTPPAEPIGTGRRAENKLRHEASNYDEMLREGAKNVGGILHPQQYVVIRRGVDRIVRGEIAQFETKH